MVLHSESYVPESCVMKEFTLGGMNFRDAVQVGGVAWLLFLKNDFI